MSFTGEVRPVFGVQGKTTSESLEIRAKAQQYASILMKRPSAGHF